MSFHWLRQHPRWAWLALVIALLADADGWQRPFLIAVGLIVVVVITFVSMTRHVEPMERWLGAVIAWALLSLRRPAAPVATPEARP